MEKYGIVFVFDEVVIGFWFVYGGVQEYYGVILDLCIFGKIIGGGFLLVVIVGKKEIMVYFDKVIVGEVGFIFQIGILSGNFVVSVVGLKIFEIFK